MFLMFKDWNICTIFYNIKNTFANSGPELDTDPWIKCGYFSLTQAAIEPGYDPPNAIQGPENPWDIFIASINVAKSFCPCLTVNYAAKFVFACYTMVSYIEKTSNNYLPWRKPYELFCCYGRCRLTFSVISVFKHKKSRLLFFSPFYPCPIMQPMIGYCSFSSNIEKNRASFLIVFKTMQNILISERFDLKIIFLFS